MIASWTVSKHPLIEKAGRLLVNDGSLAYVDTPAFGRPGAIESATISGRAQIIPMLGDNVTFGRYAIGESIWFGMAFRLWDNWEFSAEPETIALLQHTYTAPFLTTLVKPPWALQVVGTTLQVVHAWFAPGGPWEASAQVNSTVTIFEDLQSASYYTCAVNATGGADESGEMHTYIGDRVVDYRSGPNHFGDAPIYPVAGLKRPAIRTIEYRRMHIGAMVQANLGFLHLFETDIYPAILTDAGVV